MPHDHWGFHPKPEKIPPTSHLLDGVDPYE
jgi:hypothetical protein